MANDDEFAPAEYVSDEEQVNDEIEIQPVKVKKAKRKQQRLKRQCSVKNNFFYFK